jgi:hypothetical protein
MMRKPWWNRSDQASFRDSLYSKGSGRWESSSGEMTATGMTLFILRRLMTPI